MSISESQSPIRTTSNPNIYLNYLSPKVAYQFEYARDLYLATLGALLWDMLVSMPDELALLKSGFSPTLLAYIASRSFTLTYVLLSVVIKTHDVWHCKAIEFGSTICWVFASGSTSLLLLHKVVTVYSNKTPIRLAFLVFLLLIVGISCLTPIGSHLSRLANTGYCVSAVESYAAAPMFFRLAFDICIFLAIAFRVATMQGLSGEPVTWTTVMSRNSSSRLMRAGLRDGQQHYLMCICMDILVVALIVTPTVPRMYQTMFIVPNLALYSSMGCRVFRNLKLVGDKVDSAMSDLLFKTFGHAEGATQNHRPSASMSAYFSSPTSTLHLPPPEVRIRSVSTTSLRLRDGEVERYSILKVKPASNIRGSKETSTRNR